MDAWSLLGVPLYTVAGYSGMGRAPSVLRNAGVAKLAGVSKDLGDVTLQPLREDVVEGRVKNLGHFRRSTSVIYGDTRSVKEARVIVLGGECSETVGVMAGLAETFGGRPGILWMDAHGDFNTPDTSSSGYIGGMCLALAAGRSPELELLQRPAPLADDRVVHMGSRALDPAEVKAFGSSEARLITSQQVKKRGARRVAEEATAYLEDVSDWIACHLDLDVVDPEFIPAVDYPEPGGMTLEDASAVVRTLLETGRVKVVEVTAYDPSRDRQGTSMDRIVGLLKAAFR